MLIIKETWTNAAYVKRVIFTTARPRNKVPLCGRKGKATPSDTNTQNVNISLSIYLGLQRTDTFCPGLSGQLVLSRVLLDVRSGNEFAKSRCMVAQTAKGREMKRGIVQKETVPVIR